MMKRLYVLILSCFLLTTLKAQEDLLSKLSESTQNEKEAVFQTFKGTRVVNGHSVEVKGKNELEFIIGHRFGTINSGAYNFFGWDAAYIRFGLEYGITSKLGVGVGRSSYNKIYDSYLKYMLVRQSKGGGSPVSITVLGSTGVQTVDKTLNFRSQLFFSGQALVARKFTPGLSMQLSSIFVHANRVDQLKENNSQLAIGLSGRCKITKSMAINGEYFYRANSVPNGPYHDAIGLGFDIETGGHVFQLIFSNTQGMIDRTFVGQTDGNFFKGDIHFGFNVTRTFQLGKAK